jgi:hypothetical protein
MKYYLIAVKCCDGIMMIKFNTEMQRNDFIALLKKINPDLSYVTAECTD